LIKDENDLIFGEFVFIKVNPEFTHIGISLKIYEIILRKKINVD